MVNFCWKLAEEVHWFSLLAHTLLHRQSCSSHLLSPTHSSLGISENLLSSCKSNQGFLNDSQTLWQTLKVQNISGEAVTFRSSESVGSFFSSLPSFQHIPKRSLALKRCCVCWSEVEQVEVHWVILKMKEHSLPKAQVPQLLIVLFDEWDLVGSHTYNL